jgi:hypothetical protein
VPAADAWGPVPHDVVGRVGELAPR